MKPPENIEKLIKNIDVDTNAKMDKVVLDDVLKALENSKKEKVAVSQPNIWKTIMKARIAKLTVAAAVIIAGVLIGISMFSGSDKRPSAEIEPAEGKLGVELASIEQMFKAGNVDGLAAILSEGEFESKVASANYLAKLGAVEAVGLLENISNDYGTYNRDNPFAHAAEEIKNRAAAKANSSTAAERIMGVVAMQTQTKAGNFELSSAGNVMSFQAEAKEVADGYPIKGGGHSIAEVVSTSLYQNLVLYYSFYTDEDPNTAVDISGRYFHGQVHGSKYTKDETLGGTMSFDGDDDYISIPDVYLKEFSFSAWVKTQGSDINNRRIFLLRDGKNCYGLQGNVRGCVGIYVADNKEINEYDWRLSKDTWTHITVTHDGRRFAIYRNGRLTEAGDIETSGVTGTLYLGGTDKHNGGFWRGMLDEVAFFNRALSEEEVGQLYLMTGEMVATGPTLTEGASGNGYYFDGDGDYIDVGTISGLGVEQTKMLWIYMEAFPLPHDVYLIDEGGNNNWIELFDSDGNGVPEVRAGFDGSNYFDSDGEIEQGHWYHIAVVSTSTGDVDIYINGVFDSSRSGFSATNEPQAILIGGDSVMDIASFKGVIDEVAIFNRALSDYEIQQVYQNVGRLSGNEPGLLAYWNFDADEGDIVKDSSPYHNDGKLRDR